MSMINENVLQNIKSLISGLEIGKAIDFTINQGMVDSDITNSLIALKSRWSKLQFDRDAGVIHGDDYYVMENKIVATLLSILNDLREESKSRKKEVEEKWSKSDNKSILNEASLQLNASNLEEVILLLNILINKHDSIYSEYRHDVQLLSSRFKNILNSDRNGTASNQEIFLEKNKLTSALSQLIADMIELPNRKVEEKKTIERIEKSAASYVVESIGELEKREKRLKNQAAIWYITGFLSLASGVIIGFSFLTSASFDNDSIGIVVYQIIKSLFIIGLLVALSRYSFLLGKSFMNESLKNADRIHSISFEAISKMNLRKLA